MTKDNRSDPRAAAPLPSLPEVEVRGGINLFDVARAYGTPSFINGPYTVAPRGKSSVTLLLTSNGVPVPDGEVTLTLPAGFTHPEGGSQKTLLTDAAGQATFRGVQSAAAPGSYVLTAQSGEITAKEEVTVVALASLPPVTLPDTGIDMIHSPDGTLIFILMFPRPISSLVMINTLTGEVSTLAEGVGPAGRRAAIAVSPDSRRVYAGQSVIDVPTRQIVGVFENPLRTIGISPDGSRLYGTYSTDNGTGMLCVMNAATLEVLARLVLPGGVSNLKVSPDGERLYLLVRYSQKTHLHLVDAMSLTLLPVSFPESVSRMLLSHDGMRILTYVYNKGFSILNGMTLVQEGFIPLPDPPKHDSVAIYAMALSGDQRVIYAFTENKYSGDAALHGHETEIDLDDLTWPVGSVIKEYVPSCSLSADFHRLYYAARDLHNPPYTSLLLSKSVT